VLIYRVSSCGQPTRGGPSAWGLVEVLTTPRLVNVTKHFTGLVLGLIVW
jgi:hypothetical protein